MYIEIMEATSSSCSNNKLLTGISKAKIKASTKFRLQISKEHR